jgi:DNA-binding beta-propeller fold protein YncE
MKVQVLKRHSMAILLAGTMAIGGSITVLAADAAGPYKIEQQWKIGGDGGWDYLNVDPVTHLLYLSRGTRVLVVDTNSGKVVNEIPGFKGVHGIIFDASGKFGYISDGGGNSVHVFDRATRQTVAAIPAGTNPDGMVFEPVTKTIWAFNGRSKNATVIDSSNNSVVATIPLPGKPEFPVADGTGTVFVNIEDTSQIVRLDAKNLKATATWSLAPCDGPSGLAMDIKHRRLFSVCDGKKMAVVDADSGKVVATPEIGDGPDAAGFDPRHELAFSSNGEGTLTVVHEDSPDKYSVVQSLPTQRGARTMAFDSSNGKLYLVTAQFGPRPAATPENPRPRPPVLPDTFVVLVVGR